MNYENHTDPTQNFNSSVKKILYIIPADVIGGVEVAAKSLDSGRHGNLSIEKYYLVSPDKNTLNPKYFYGPVGSQNSINVIISAIKFFLKSKPDLIVASLWRSVIVMIICKLLRPKQKTVLFLHSTKSAHLADAIVSAIGIRVATEIWVDSQATRDARCQGRSLLKCEIVSFLLEKKPHFNPFPLSPEFIFWGRLRAPKNLSRTVRIFQKIKQHDNRARLRIIGPDGGERAKISKLIQSLDLESSIEFLGPLSHAQIFEEAKSAVFYLQTSSHEGMCMAVVEAMQLSLIPVVTPVGEIANYCVDGFNSIIIDDDDTAVESLKNVLVDTEKRNALAKGAQETWSNVPVYSEEFLRLAARLTLTEIRKSTTTNFL